MVNFFAISTQAIAGTGVVNLRITTEQGDFNFKLTPENAEACGWTLQGEATRAKLNNDMENTTCYRQCNNS